MDVVSKPDLSFIEVIKGVPLVAGPIAFLVSLVLLRFYRRAVIRSMQLRATLGAAVGLENRPACSGGPPGHSLEIMPDDPPGDGARLAVRRAAWPWTAVEVCAGLTYGIVVASSELVAFQLGFEWQRLLFWQVFLFFIIWLAWPMVITIGLAIAVSWRGFAVLLVGYALAFAGVGTPTFAYMYTDATAEQMRAFLWTWLYSNGLGTLLVLVFLARPIRAVGPLVFVFVIAAMGGSVFVVFYFNQLLQVFNWVHFGILVGAALLSVTGAVATGIIGWLLLRWLITGSRQQLTNWLNANTTGRLRAFTLARPITALVVVIMITAVTGAILIVGLFGSDQFETLLWAIIVKLAFYIEIVLLLLIGAVPTGIIAWLLLRWLGSLYRARRISDQSIMIDAVWLMFSFMQVPSVGALSGRPAATFFIAIGAFVAYKLVATVGFRLLRTGAAKDAQASKLLLLRVFSLGTRSERLFAGFTKLWRHMGSVRMIAGPDLATSTVEPHEFLDFLAGQLQRRFIAGPDTLEQRLRETEQKRDVDGRFRIADFFCHDDTWQMVLRRLEKDSDVVLMDLRGFSQSNRGCVFEINELLDVVLLRHLVFVVDRTTDERFLAQVFADAWATVTKASPNWNDPAPRLSLYHFDGHFGQNIPALVAVVANAGMHYAMRNEAQETSR